MNGILALLDIGTIVIDGTGCIGDEVRKRVGHDEWFSNTVTDIVSLMLPSEVQTFAADEIQTLESFDLKRRGHGIFDGFKEAVNIFRIYASNVFESCIQSVR